MTYSNIHGREIWKSHSLLRVCGRVHILRQHKYRKTVISFDQVKNWSDGDHDVNAVSTDKEINFRHNLWQNEMWSFFEPGSGVYRGQDWHSGRRLKIGINPTTNRTQIFIKNSYLLTLKLKTVNFIFVWNATLCSWWCRQNMNYKTNFYIRIAVLCLFKKAIHMHCAFWQKVDCPKGWNVVFPCLICILKHKKLLMCDWIMSFI